MRMGRGWRQPLRVALEVWGHKVQRGLLEPLAQRVRKGRKVIPERMGLMARTGPMVLMARKARRASKALREPREPRDRRGQRGPMVPMG